MKRTLTFLFSLFLLHGAAHLHAQETDENAVDETDSRRSYIGISVDYGKIFTLFTNFETKAEIGLDLTVSNKFKILGELGYAQLRPESFLENGEYESKGIYYRGGIAYGGEILPKSYLYFGVMYGANQFEDSGRVVVFSEAYEDFEETFQRTDLTASWFEVLLISETEFRKNMFLGFKFRLRIQYDFPTGYNPEVSSIPGYGRIFDNTIPAFNLYYKYIIPF